MLKPFFACSLAAAAGFVFMGFQTGLFDGSRPDADEEKPAEVQTVAAVVKAPPRAVFPDDLAPAALAKPVDAAATFKVAKGPHKLVFLKPNGAPHPWQKDAVDYSEEWVATNVEETELAVILGGQSKKMIQRVMFPNGPPVDRIEWQLEVSVVEAKTGRVLAHRVFINRPREVRNFEAYALTALGMPVRYLTVFNWVAGQAQAGFSSQVEQPPLVTVVERQ